MAEDGGARTGGVEYRFHRLWDPGREHEGRPLKRWWSRPLRDDGEGVRDDAVGGFVEVADEVSVDL